MKNLVIILLSFVTLCAYTEIIAVKKNNAAKVGDKIITKSEVAKRAEILNVSYDAALNDLIDFEILYNAARIYVGEPDEKAINESIKNDKYYYASHFRKEINEVTDHEFITASGIGNGTMKEYIEYTREKIMVDEYLSQLYEESDKRASSIGQQEIEAFIKAHPQRFEKDEQYEVMLIYFSYFDKSGMQLPDDDIVEKARKAATCLEKLNQGMGFSEAAIKYSEDLLTLKATPPGYFGVIEKNDEFMKKRFTKEIIAMLAESEPGVIKKIYGTNDGLYIFKLISKTPASKMNEFEANSTAQNMIASDKIQVAREEIKKKKLEEFRKIFEVKIF